MASRAQGLPHLGKCVPVLPALRSLPTHSHSFGQFYATDSPFSARLLRPHGAPSEARGYTYCLIAVDHFICWPEINPTVDITADTMVCTLLTGWISHTALKEGLQASMLENVIACHEMYYLSIRSRNEVVTDALENTHFTENEESKNEQVQSEVNDDRFLRH